MIFRKLFIAVVILALGCALPAQDKGYWRTASKNAAAITGDISLADTKVTIDFYTFTMSQIRTLSSAEVAAVFDTEAGAGFNGALYRLMVPAGTRMLHKNTLCGTADTQWMATFVTGRNLKVAFFSGDTTPVFSFEAITNSADICGIFTYGR